MSKMVQVRNVPDRIHRKLKARAASEGLSLSDYILGELRQIVERPTLRELAASLPNFDDDLAPSPAEMIRRERERR